MFFTETDRMTNGQESLIKRKQFCLRGRWGSPGVPGTLLLLSSSAAGQLIPDGQIMLVLLR